MHNQRNLKTQTQFAVGPQTPSAETETLQECREAQNTNSEFQLSMHDQRRGAIRNQRKANSSRRVARPKHNQRNSETNT